MEIITVGNTVMRLIPVKEALRLIQFNYSLDEKAFLNDITTEELINQCIKESTGKQIEELSQVEIEEQRNAILVQEKELQKQLTNYDVSTVNDIIKKDIIGTKLGMEEGERSKQQYYVDGVKKSEVLFVFEKYEGFEEPAYIQSYWNEIDLLNENSNVDFRRSEYAMNRAYYISLKMELERRKYQALRKQTPNRGEIEWISILNEVSSECELQQVIESYFEEVQLTFQELIKELNERMEDKMAEYDNISYFLSFLNEQENQTLDLKDIEDKIQQYKLELQVVVEDISSRRTLYKFLEKLENNFKETKESNKLTFFLAEWRYCIKENSGFKSLAKKIYDYERNLWNSFMEIKNQKFTLMIEQEGANYQQDIFTWHDIQLHKIGYELYNKLIHFNRGYWVQRLRYHGIKYKYNTENTAQ